MEIIISHRDNNLNFLLFRTHSKLNLGESPLSLYKMKAPLEEQQREHKNFNPLHTRKTLFLNFISMLCQRDKDDNLVPFLSEICPFSSLSLTPLPLKILYNKTRATCRK